MKTHSAAETMDRADTAFECERLIIGEMVHDGAADWRVIHYALTVNHCKGDQMEIREEATR